MVSQRQSRAMTQSATEPGHFTKGNLAMIRRELPIQTIRRCTTDFVQAKPNMASPVYALWAGLRARCDTCRRFYFLPRYPLKSLRNPIKGGLTHPFHTPAKISNILISTLIRETGGLNSGDRVDLSPQPGQTRPPVGPTSKTNNPTTGRAYIKAKQPDHRSGLQQSRCLLHVISLNLKAN